MLAKFLTKPLQGSLFWRLRAVIIGWAHVDILQDYFSFPNKERIEKHIFGNEPETLQNATYNQVVNGNQLRKTDGTEWSKFGPKEQKGFWRLIKVVRNSLEEQKAYEVLLKSYISIKKTSKVLSKFYRSLKKT